MIIHYTPDAAPTDTDIVLPEEEAVHCYKVLRAKPGDQIYTTDGRGGLYTVNLTSISRQSCNGDIVHYEIQRPTDYTLSIAIAPTKKPSRIEWAIEKMVEIGVHNIWIINTQRSLSSRLKEQRLSNIMISAMKQSKNLYLPQLTMNVAWKDLIKAAEGIPYRYIAHCEDPTHHLARLCPASNSSIIAIGPEGDFTLEEINMAKDNEWREVNLGPSRLRTETAGVVAAGIVSYINI